MAISLTTAFTIIGSFGAASTAQIISHILTKKREDKKYKKEAFQKLYSPTSFKVLEYIETEGYNRSPLQYDKQLDSNEAFKSVTDLIGSNLSYAEVNLISTYQDILGIESIENIGSKKHQLRLDDNLISEKVKLSNIFLTQYLKISKELKLDLTAVNNKIKAPFFFSHFFLLVKECLYITEPKSWDIFEFYYLMEGILIPDNNYLERVIDLRKDLHDAMYNSNLSDVIVAEAFSNTYNFFYELVEEFDVLNPKIAEHWKDMIDEDQEFHYRIP